MRTYFCLLLTSLVLIGLFTILSCSPSAPYIDDHEFPIAQEGIATNIKLAINDLHGSQSRGIITLPAEGEVLILITDYDVTPDHALEIYATAAGYYTELYFCENNTSITIDLDKVPPGTDAMTGVLISLQSWGYNYHAAHQTMVFTHTESDFTYTTTTDNQGRWGIQNAPLGLYNVSLPNIGHYSGVVLPPTNTHGVNYQDLSFIEDIQVDAPNIYLYPETQTDISVTLGFPSGGGVILSDPPYNSGWNVDVTPEGIIDGEYNYLFYEAKVQMPLQQMYGWSLDGSNLEFELRQLLQTLNFQGREIDDFVDFWLPKISGSPWYAIYPQDAEQMSTLTISPPPESIMRALFTIRPMNHQVNLITPPENTQFQRDGFTVVEWGVIDWHD